MTTIETADTRTGAPVVEPLTAVIGAEVTGVDLGRPLSDGLAEELRAALVEHKVLFFRDQHLDRDQHVALGRRFGPLTPGHPRQGSPGDHPEIMVVDASATRRTYGLEGERSRFGPPRFTRAGWHTDITFVVNPALGSILRAVAVPPHGGDTLWTDLEAAYADLSAPVRDLLDGLQAVHVWHGYDVADEEGGDGSLGLKDGVEQGGRPAAVHPVVRVHPVSGRRSLFVSPVFTRYLVGLTDRESDSLLSLLFDQLARPEFTVRFRWTPGSVAFWDNRSTAHLGPIDAAVSGADRRLERVTIVGDVPVGPDGFRSESLVGGRFA